MESRTVYTPSYISSMEGQGISIRKFKDMALGLPVGHPLRAVLEVEADVISPQDFVVKSPTWFKLIDVKA